jgi:serine/threonine protein kinase
VPEVFGNRYEVIERVGDGGMATVYRGLDRVLRRDVAIKVMHPHLAARNDARARFNREAQAIARLHHSNIVDVYDFSVGTDETAFLVTEFVHGDTLTQFTNEHGPFVPQAAALIGFAVAAALGHAHSVGIVHRDIKPDNLMISRDGQIKLMDFGIATAMDLEQMTATGAILGSPAHMAPEQIEGGTLDQRADIFAFGTVLYFLVTRKLPFVASNPHALFHQILQGQFEPAGKHNTQVDRVFDGIIAQCLARLPSDRYPDMGKLQEALMSYLKTFRMSDVATLLPRFLKAPEVFQFDLKPTLVHAMTLEGRRLADTGQLALAIDSFNRALVLDPDADEPKRGLHDLTTRSKRRRQVRRLSLAAAIVASLGVLAWGALAVWQTAQEPGPVQEAGTAVPRPQQPPAVLPRTVAPVLDPPVHAPVDAATVAVDVPATMVVLPLPVTEATDAARLQALQQHLQRRVQLRLLDAKDRRPPMPGPDAVQTPTPPEVHERVDLSTPFGFGNATLRIHRPGDAHLRDVGQGYAGGVELAEGPWLLVCDYAAITCPDCTPEQLHKERPFQVPVKRDNKGKQLPLRCDKPGP